MPRHPPGWISRTGETTRQTRRAPWCRPASREQAMEALRQQVTACTHCRPDTALGLLD
ncbi:DUF6233 domain-containing protein [Streptomyces flavofungini]|uniref:DUF6233 domain-containing protein n=1 Tax=Streptomyces flavofungini TaxID=68200 RepID=UPI0034DEADCB